MKTKLTRLFVDQYGQKFYAATVKELRAQIHGGGCKVSRMYVDRMDGSTYAVGYCVGDLWLTEFARVEKKQ